MLELPLEKIISDAKKIEPNEPLSPEVIRKCLHRLTRAIPDLSQLPNTTIIDIWCGTRLSSWLEWSPWFARLAHLAGAWRVFWVDIKNSPGECYEHRMLDLLSCEVLLEEFGEFEGLVDIVNNTGFTWNGTYWDAYRTSPRLIRQLTWMNAPDSNLIASLTQGVNDNILTPQIKRLLKVWWIYMHNDSMYQKTHRGRIKKIGYLPEEF